MNPLPPSSPYKWSHIGINLRPAIMEIGRWFDPLWWHYFVFQPVLYNWCNEGIGV